MPSKSKAQQKFMGMVHALNKGDIKPSDVSQSVRDTAKSMKKSDAKDFASTKHKGLPKKVKQEILNRLKEYANKMGTDHLGGDDYTSSKKGGLRDFDGYDNVDYNKDMPMDESKRSVVYKAAKKGSFPVTLVVVKNGKVVDQELVKIPEAVPAAFNVIQSKHKGAKIHIEDKTGKRLFSESADYKYLTQTILDAKPKYNVYYNSGHNKVNIGGVGYDSGELVKQFNQKPGSSSKIKNNFYHADQDPQKTKREVEKLSKGKIKVDIQKGYGGKPMAVYIVKESVNEGMFSAIDQIRQNSKNVKDFIKNVLSDKQFRDMKSDKDFIKYLGSIYEGVQENFPSNWLQGRTSDYHTKLRGKKREYDDTNFEKDNSGQTDLEESGYSLEDLIGQVKTFDKPKTQKLLTILVINKLKVKRNNSKSKSNKVKIQKLIDKIEGDYKRGRYLNEAPIHAMMATKAAQKAMQKRKLKNPKTGKEVSVSTALKDKDHPNHNQAKSLFKRLKSKLVGEYGSKLTEPFLLPKDEDKLDGTPDSIDTINRNLDEGTMIRRAVDIAQELLPKDTWSRHASDGKKNAEFVKNVVRDLTQSLNKFYKNHNISVRIKEEEGDSNVDMVLGVLSILRQIEDKENRQKVAIDMIKKFKEQNIDFDYKEFLELMKEYNK